MRRIVRRALAVSLAIGGIVVQAGASGAASAATGHLAGPMTSVISGCDDYWFSVPMATIGAVVIQSDRTAIAPEATAEAVLIGAVCGAQSGRLDLSASWQTTNGKQVVFCSGFGVYTVQAGTHAVGLRSSTSCEWLDFATGTRVNFVGQFSGALTPALLGRAAILLNMS